MVSDCLLGLLFFGSQEIAISMGDAALQPLMEVVSFTFYSFQFFLSIVEFSRSFVDGA